MSVKKITLSAVSCAVLSVFATRAFAEEWKKEPSYGVELGLNDNYTLEPDPDSATGTQKDQQVATLKARAQLALVQEKPAYSARLEGKLIATSYGGDTKGYRFGDEYRGAVLDDRLDAIFEAGFEGRSERSRWRMGATLLTDSLLQEINLEVTEVADTENDDNDDGTVREDVTRTRLTLVPSYEYRLSPVSFVQSSMVASASTYNNTANTALVNHAQVKLRSLYSREFSRVNSWNVDGEYSKYKASKGGEYDSAVFGVGVDHKFSEITRIGLRVAQATTSYSNKDGSTGRVNRPLVQLFGSKTTGRTQYSMRLGGNLYGSATGDVVRAEELLFNIVYQYSELMTLTWRNKFFQNYSLQEVRDNPTNDSAIKAKNDAIENNNRRYLAFEPTVNWRFSRWWVMDAGFRYQREKRDGKANPGESNYLFLGVTFSKPVGVPKEG